MSVYAFLCNLICSCVGVCFWGFVVVHVNEIMNPTTIPTVVEDLQGDGRWISMVRTCVYVFTMEPNLFTGWKYYAR
jgi:hypothetical protein